MEPFILLSLTKSKNRVGILSSKNPLKNIRPIFTRLHVDSHIIRIFTKKKDMVAKYKRHLLVEFKNSIQSSEQKSAKWTEFFLIFKYHFLFIYFDMMIGRKHGDKVINTKILRLLSCLIILFVYFLNDSVGYHVSLDLSILIVSYELKLNKWMRSVCKSITNLFFRWFILKCLFNTYVLKITFLYSFISSLFCVEFSLIS